MPLLRRRLLAPLLAVAAAAPVHPASADDGPRALGTAMLPAYRQECGACHIPYPPAMLPPASWQRLMSDLPHHFGTDASLDAPTVAALSNWLGANAGTYKRVREEPPQDRITRSAWFVRKHDEVPAAAWKLPAVKSPANCVACHVQADRGNFDEHLVRIPR